MGLDIYFNRAKTICKAEKEDAYNAVKEQRNEISDKLYGDKNLSEIEKTALKEICSTLDEACDNLNPYGEEVAYFRKVNFLMKYFDYEGNCEYTPITKGQIVDLIDNCKKVLTDHSLAEELLPTQGGFFFGNTDYNEYYFDDVKEVLEEFKKILDETDWDTETIYMYAWW